MKLTNNQILLANEALSTIILDKINGKLAFKLFKIKRDLENEVIIITKSTENKDEKEQLEILKIENEISINKITEEEINTLNLSIQDVFYLEPLIDYDKKEN